jgi:presenilin-like A22 family membrane protease
MKPNWLLLGIAILGGAALSSLILILVAYQYGNQPSVRDLELAAVLGGAIGGMLILITASRPQNRK